MTTDILFETWHPLHIHSKSEMPLDEINECGYFNSFDVWYNDYYIKNHKVITPATDDKDPFYSMLDGTMNDCEIKDLFNGIDMLFLETSLFVYNDETYETQKFEVDNVDEFIESLKNRKVFLRDIEKYEHPELKYIIHVAVI